MTRRLLLALCLLGAATATTTTASAKDRTTAELQQIAAERLTKNHARTPLSLGSSTAPRAVRCTMNEGGVAIYAAEGSGSVLLAVDDRLAPVIGYTDAVISSVDDLPCAMQWWLGQMQRQAQAFADAADATDADNATDTDADATTTASAMRPYEIVQPASSSYTVVEPLLTTRWEQLAPYNSLCPTINGQATPTGCAATAMSQILNYNQYPASAHFSGHCVTVDGEEKTDHTEEINSTYAYPFQTAYGAYSSNGANRRDAQMDYTDEAGLSVGTLLRDCGYSIHMNYGVNGSGANTLDVTGAAVSCFSYPRAAVKHHHREYYTADEWRSLVYGEIMAGYPVLYAGQDSISGGHAFIAHGIDSDGLVYVNWGWAGRFDGYYAMELMDPAGDEFSGRQEIVTGWHPTALPGDAVQSQWAAENLSMSTDSARQAIILNAGVYNTAAFAFTGRLIIHFEDQTADSVDHHLLFADEEAGAHNWGNGYVFADTDLAPYLEGNLENGHTYKCYFTSQQEDEAEPQMMRVSGGGRFYFLVSLDDEGHVTIGDQQIASSVTPQQMTTQPATTAATDDATYNLAGRRVGATQRGFVIRGGKKMIVR